MGAPERSLNEQDPDYVSAISNNETQQKIYEENGEYNDINKIIINNINTTHRLYVRE